MNGANKLVCGFECGLSRHEHRGLSESPRHLVQLAKSTEGNSFSGHSAHTGEDLLLLLLTLSLSRTIHQ